jgi:hemerythrin-like metal-binding protein
MTVRPCNPEIIGGIAVLQSAFPVMPMPEGIASFIEAGLTRVPGISAARMAIRTEASGAGESAPFDGERIWLDTLDGRYGWLDLSLSDRAEFIAYEPYVRNLANALALHVENVQQRERLERMLVERQRIEDALREADRRKDEFLGVLSHELRNPLAPIRNSIYIMLRAAPGSEQARRAVQVIRRQTAHLTRMVDDLLDVKRISTGKLRVHASRADLTRIVLETVEDLRPLFDRRSVALEIAVPSEPIWVHGDPTRLVQIITNLLHNASKFTNAGGRVRVSLGRHQQQARIAVRDDGVGIPHQLIGQVFDPFVQSEETLARTRGGLGLGLSLVRGIAELHGGSAVAHSDGPGRGSEFVVTIPTAEPGGRAAGDGAVVLETTTAKRRILIVEDNADAADSLRDVLAVASGHEVHVVGDGAAAVEAASRLAPDVILCDLGLPVLDGYEVARRIRAGNLARPPQLVALSGYAGTEDVERALRAGFDYHVAKPPDIDELMKLLGNASGSRASKSAPHQLETGHPEVDLQHAAILEEAARLRNAKPEAIWESIRFLEHHATSHFTYEEALMDDVAYPRAAVHQQQHIEFVSEIARLRARLERDGPTSDNVGALANAVEQWVAEHVLDEDRRLAEFIRHGELGCC